MFEHSVMGNGRLFVMVQMGPGGPKFYQVGPDERAERVWQKCRGVLHTQSPSSRPLAGGHVDLTLPFVPPWSCGTAAELSPLVQNRDAAVSQWAGISRGNFSLCDEKETRTSSSQAPTFVFCANSRQMETADMADQNYFRPLTISICLSSIDGKCSIFDFYFFFLNQCALKHLP